LHNTVAISVVLKSITDFVAAINSHDVETIAALMADDHTFIDAHGNEVTGKETMKDGWASYFQLFPDYYIEIEEIFTKGDLAMAYGRVYFMISLMFT
jgi:ketosteroid isomerase-like protein